MRIDFSPRLQMNPLLALQAGQAAMGTIQSIAGMIQQKKATKALEKLQTPTYNQSGSILDYYNKALQRYNVNPESTNLYKMQQQNIQRNLAGGITALGDRRSALSGINRLVAGADDASLKANVAAENERNQRFGQLGSATGMKADEEMKDFQFNKLAPYEKKYNLLAMKASGGTQIANSGFSNMFGGLNSMSQTGMLNKEYGGRQGVDSTGGRR